ncbi:MAG: HEAT repeat domain-containing protein [Gemmataceae bacterium]
MRRYRLLLALLAASLIPCAAQAGGRWSIGLHFGMPWCGPCYRPVMVAPVYPVYVAPAPVVVQPAAVVAVPAAPAPTATAYAQPETAEPAPAPVARAASWNDPASTGGLTDANPRARAEAALRLGRQKDRRAVASLVRVLQDDSYADVREAAARALGLIGAPQALAALQHAAGADEDRDVRRTASFAADVIRAAMPR